MVHIKQAQQSDVAKIREIAFQIWPKHYTPIIGEQQVNYMLSTKYGSDVIAAQMRNQTHDYFLLLNDANESIGFAAIQQQSESHYFLDKFYILESAQTKGNGTEALKKLIQWYPSLEELRLQVNRKNYKAINFYFKFGFKIEQVEDFNIGEGFFMNDFVMLYKKTRK